jgi:hypothetical protein
VEESLGSVDERVEKGRSPLAISPTHPHPHTQAPTRAGSRGAQGGRDPHEWSSALGAPSPLPLLGPTHDSRVGCVDPKWQVIGCNWFPSESKLDLFVIGSKYCSPRVSLLTPRIMTSSSVGPADFVCVSSFPVPLDSFSPPIKSASARLIQRRFQIGRVQSRSHLAI